VRLTGGGKGRGLQIPDSYASDGCQEDRHRAPTAEFFATAAPIRFAAPKRRSKRLRAALGEDPTVNSDASRSRAVCQRSSGSFARQRADGAVERRRRSAAGIVLDGSRFFFEDGRSDTELTLPLKRSPARIPSRYNTGAERKNVAAAVELFSFDLLPEDMY